MNASAFLREVALFYGFILSLALLIGGGSLIPIFVVLSFWNGWICAIAAAACFVASALGAVGVVAIIRTEPLA